MTDSEGRRLQRPSSSSSTSSSFHFAAGLGSGILSAVLLQPADLLKTRVQQSGSSSLTDVFRDIRRSPLPVRQLWRGTLPSALRTGIGSALYFSTLNALRQQIARRSSQYEAVEPPPPAIGTPIVRPAEAGDEITTTDVAPLPAIASSSSSLPKLSNGANLMTGALARGSVGFVMMPITVIKVRYESNLYAYRSLWGACSDIVRRDGVRGFFAGFGATAIRDAPYAGLYVLFYEQSKKTLSRLAEREAASPSPSPASLAPSPSSSSSAAAAATAIDPTYFQPSRSASINFASGMLAASMATAFTNPFDAIKTRIQLLPDQYTNLVQAGRRMVREDGFRSLLDGLGLRMARKALSSALAWTLYEDIIRRVETRLVV